MVYDRTGLIQAFHSTLEEVKYADLLLLVVDATDSENRIVDVIIPYSDGRKVQLLNDNARIISQEYLAEGVHIVADCPKWLDI